VTQKHTGTTRGYHDADIERTLGLWWCVWGEQLAHVAVQPRTELFEQIQANILLAHLDPMQGRFGHGGVGLLDIRASVHLTGILWRRR
jgi:hypothetical protein